MSLTPDALDRALVDLAARADRDQPTDRVPAIHRRARRDAAVRAATVAGALTAVVAVVLLVVGPGLPFTRADSADPAVGRTKPFLTVALARDDKLAAALPANGLGGIAVVVQITQHGLVPQLSNAAGEKATGTDNLLGLQMDWGDHSNDGANPQYKCVPGARLVHINNDFVMTHHYAPGTYTISYRTGACDPVGEVTRTVTVKVG
jgi:tetrahydromethanopterin S-methyltransferase subunit F